MTLDNNDAILKDLQALFSLGTLPHTSVSIAQLFFSISNILTYLNIMLRIGLL